MLTLTESAGARLSVLLNDQADGSVVRIVRLKQRLHLRLDQLRVRDQTFTHQGRVVLALDEKVSRSLSSRQLDVRETKTGPRLRMKKSTDPDA